MVDGAGIAYFDCISFKIKGEDHASENRSFMHHSNHGLPKN